MASRTLFAPSSSIIILASVLFFCGCEKPGQRAKSDPLSDGLVLHYDFELSGDGVVPDQSGRGHVGSFVGSPSITDGDLDGKALQIESPRDWVSVKHPTLETSTWEGLSFSVWVKKAKDTTYGTILSRGMEDGDAISFGFQHGGSGNGGGLWYKEWIYPEQLPKRTLTVGEWHHMVGTWDGETLLFYLNGEVGSAEQTVSENWKDDPGYTLAIGKCLGSRRDWLDSYTNGWIDNVRLYDRALTPAEVATLFREKR